MAISMALRFSSAPQPVVGGGEKPNVSDAPRQHLAGGRILIQIGIVIGIGIGIDVFAKTDSGLLVSGPQAFRFR